jgi:hypothetical protein
MMSVKNAIQPRDARERSVAILAQLAFVAFLLIGRVAASVVDASVMPSFDSTGAPQSVQAGLAIP